MQTGHHLVVDASAQVGILGYGQSAIVVVGYEGDVIVSPVGSLSNSVANVAKLEAIPFRLVSADGPVETWVE